MAYFSTSVVLSRDCGREGETRKLLHRQWMTNLRLSQLLKMKAVIFFSELRESITLLFSLTTQKIRILDGRDAGLAN